mmetsp:Transcript_12069/g.26317  ORF Transcript_12069/g.26317 Transcript_12069/m.26317 type:complete len:249 (+) Transcript_12069:1916-2662(+)
MPFARRAFKLLSNPSLDISMMCVFDKANSSASATREVDLESSEMTSPWMASRKEICVEGTTSPDRLLSPAIFAVRSSPMRCSRHISDEMVSALYQSIPQRETVAGVACSRLSTSRIMRTLSGMLRRSPLGSVNNLLSSSTLFKFSAHSGSTSPSNTIQCLRSASPRWLARIVRSKLVKIPSVHSNVVPSRTPYKPSLSTAFGSIVYSSFFIPSSASYIALSVLRELVFPTPLGPTSIIPCLISMTIFN